MFNYRPHIILLIVGIFICSSSASAQLFGNTDISRNRKIKSVESAAAVTGSEKFVRGNRTADDFVGTGSATGTTFVGAAQAPLSGAVTSSVAGLTEETAPRVNRPRIRSTTGIYTERLTIAFEPRRNSGFGLPQKTTLSKPLRKIAENRGLELILSRTGSTATLEGSVESAEQKRIAELLVLFEPGIATVTNELRVEPKTSR